MPVSVSFPTLVIELVIFLVTVVLMERLVFDPIRHAWAERERRIEEGLSASNLGREEALRGREAVQRILAEGRQQAQATIESAVAEGGKTRDQLVEKATGEFRRLVEEAQVHITAERERTAEALRARIVDIALLAASQVTGERFDRPQVRELAATIVEREGLR